MLYWLLSYLYYYNNNSRTHVRLLMSPELKAYLTQVKEDEERPPEIAPGM